MTRTLLSQRVLLCIFIIATLESWKGQAFSGSGRMGLQFLEFGKNKKSIPINEVDTTSEPISIPNGFPFGTSIQTLAYVGDNGVISFGNPFSLWVPQPFPGTTRNVRFAHVIAPYWSDNDLRKEGNVTYEVFEFDTDTNGVLSTVNNFIMEEFGNTTNFVGVYMILVEWNTVHPFPHGAENPNDHSSATQSFIAKSNTYQAIVITNLEQSYAIFTYNCGQLEWSGLDVFATIGYNSPSDNSFANHRFTGLQDTTEIACNPNPVINNVIYQISDIKSAAADQKRMCLEWYLSDFDKYEQNDINFLDQFTALPCPCQFFQALFDFRFRFSFAKDSTFCFTERFIFKAAIRECCYGFDALTFGALVTDTENGGSLLLSPIPDESLQQNNRLPQSLCCSGEVGLCDLYYERRPPNNCAGYVPLWFIWAFGDPHITTLDGLSYTFNGIGEYVLVRSMDDDIEFQGRTDVVGNANATAFCALAIKHNGITVQISFGNGEFIVLINGSDESANLITIGSNISNSYIILERLAIDSLLLSYPTGIALTTNYTMGIFNFVLNIPQSMNGKTEGLLGTFNGNISDDLIFRNGTLLSVNSTDAEKHVFGQSWQINETESIFKYMGDESVDTFSKPNHTPPFLDEISDALQENETLTNICGTNTECLFDFSQTGNEDVGMATMMFTEEVTESVTMSESFPPNISAPDIFSATVGMDSIYEFTVTGSMNVTVVINGQSSIPPNTTFTESGDTFTLTWKPANISEVFNLTIIATAEQSARSMFVPRVQLCGCLNDGTCTEAGVLNPQLPFVVLNCECPAAYDGDICSDDADGCAMISCNLAGQLCMDNAAPMAGATCNCPDGYEMIDSKCVDINECDVATSNNCTELQSCENTPGSFSCSCLSGYRPSSTSSMLCEDINECEDYNDCHHICINTNGSFYCDCREAFVLNPDNRTCRVNDNATCPSSNNCSQVCYIDNSGAELCSCERGYELDSDLITCSDINECDLTGSCSQDCSNTDGSFMCSCMNGYTLDSDGRTCNDINECLQLPEPPCMDGRLCNNSLGGYNCVCPPGTRPNETECILVEIPPSTTATSMLPTPTIIPTDTAESDDLSSGEIAGIVIGSVFAGIILLAIIVIIVVWATRYRAQSVTITPTLIMYKNTYDELPEKPALRNVYSVIMTSASEEDHNENGDVHENEEATTHL